MNPNARRQIKDIQVQAERLVNGSPAIEDIENFDKYNEELKNYLLGSLTDPELVARVRQIPRITVESNNQPVTTGIISTLLVMFSPALVRYFQQRRRIENSKDLIRDARGAYASIEFFTRNMD